MSLDLLAEYHQLLYQTEEMLALHNEEQWVNLLQGWRGELASNRTDFDLRKHAVRTARALGGIGSISQIALLSEDEPFTKLLDALYAACKQIRNLASIQRTPG